MGLDTTHDCWHGSYGNFNKFRETIAEAVGLSLTFRVGYGWPDPQDEPLVFLLNHSDCDGEIPVEELGPLAKRLRQILFLLEDEYCREKALDFAEGCELALKMGEPVRFM